MAMTNDDLIKELQKLEPWRYGGVRGILIDDALKAELISALTRKPAGRPKKAPKADENFGKEPE